jgi:hypothetical protein
MQLRKSLAERTQPYEFTEPEVYNNGLFTPTDIAIIKWVIRQCVEQGIRPDQVETVEDGQGYN